MYPQVTMLVATLYPPKAVLSLEREGNALRLMSFQEMIRIEQITLDSERFMPFIQSSPLP